MSARFLLEFQATGDQEVVNKIREVGAAGKETAADLDALKGIENPFTDITSGAENAIAPVTEMGSATEGLTGIFAGAGTATEDFSANLDAVGGAADATVGGLTDANTAVGEFGSSATTAMGGIGQMSGAIVGLGGTIGTAISTVYRMQDAQLALDKSNLKAAKSTEAARKAGVAFDSLLKDAKGNTEGITTARNELSDAQAALNQLQEAGITSGTEYEAAQTRVGTATSALRNEFAKGGGDVNKFDTAINKVALTQDAMTIAAKNLEKATREFGQTQLETGLSVAGFVGTAVQSVSSLKNMKEGATTAGTAFKGIGKALAGIGLVTIGTAFAAAGASVAVFMGAVIALNKAPYDQIIGQLDKIGKKIGETFPPLAAELTLLGDQMGTSLDFLAGYSRGLIKQLTGVELQADVTNKSFSELVELFLKDGTTGYTQINRAIAGYVDAAKKQGLTDKEIIDLAKKHNDENKKSATSTGELTTATMEYGNAADSNLVSVEGVSDAIAALPGSIGPASGATIELRAGMDALKKSQLENAKSTALSGDAASVLTQVYATLGGGVVKAQTDLELFNAAMAKQGAATERVIGPVQILGHTVTELADGWRLVDGVLSKGTQTLNTTSGAADITQSKINELNAAYATHATHGGQFANILHVESDSLDEVAASAEETNGPFSQMNATLNKSIDANALEARALLEVRDAALQNEEAISANHLAYAKSVDKLADLNAVLADSEAHHEAVETAVNNTTAALLEESIKLEAASQSADSLSDKQLRLDNAFKSGVVSIKQWANGLAEAQQEQAGQSAELAKMGAKWSDIPPFVERNIETLKLFGVAAKEGGQAARQAAAMASDAWRDATSEMGSEIDGLADILMKGGDDMDEATDDWFEGIEQKLGRELDGTEQTMSMKLADMQKSSEQAINNWQFGQLMGESVAAGASDLAGAFEDLASQAEGGMKEVFNKAAQIARTGGGQFADEVNEVMAGVGKTSPQALLDELDAILPGGLKDSAAKAGEGLPGSLDPAAGQAGQSAALTLSQEFAAAGTHIRSVIDGIKKNLATIGAKGAAKGINVGIYYRYYIIGKPPQPKPFNLGIYYRYYIVNARPNPPHLQRGIYYRYYVVGNRPNPPNINRYITYRYRTVGTRPAQTGMHENLAQDTLIAAHRGERVDITPGTISTNENRTAIIPATGANNRPININVRGDVNGKELIRFVKFNLMENTGGVM
jgi:hypothetical protein